MTEDPHIHRSGEEARQGEVVLRHKWQRLVFVGGLVVAVLLALVVQFYG